MHPLLLRRFPPHPDTHTLFRYHVRVPRCLGALCLGALDELRPLLVCLVMRCARLVSSPFTKRYVFPFKCEFTKRYIAPFITKRYVAPLLPPSVLPCWDGTNPTYFLQTPFSELSGTVQGSGEKGEGVLPSSAR